MQTVYPSAGRETRLEPRPQGENTTKASFKRQSALWIVLQTPCPDQAGSEASVSVQRFSVRSTKAFREWRILTIVSDALSSKAWPLCPLVPWGLGVWWGHYSRLGGGTPRKETEKPWPEWSELEPQCVTVWMA